MYPKAIFLLKERLDIKENLFAELVIWRVPQPVLGSAHNYKYRLALVENGICIIRYDNESGKGDHKHVGIHEVDYNFVNLEKLKADFFQDVKRRL